MKLVTFGTDDAPRLGALMGEQVLDLAAAASRLGQALPSTMQGLIEGGQHAWQNARAVIAACPAEDLYPGPPLLAPLPRPLRLRDACLFLDHIEVAFAKAGMSFSEEFRRQIIYYNADNLHVFGTDSDVPWPKDSADRDYELEWACVIGTGGIDIAPDQAASHIFGYTIFNDWSARDLQMPFMQSHLGPAGGKDFANSLGPCIVTTDEIAAPYELAMTARVNGEIWSSGSTATMFHTFEDAIVRLSAGRRLFAGEVIGSGTVIGGCGFEIGRQLALGDVVELEVEGIGGLRNRIT
jgi:2-keto-4-pentenoate hydratase/2-oxohepta-3-ene-1,7-dioic acid hydratase in catechol pathway